MAMALPTAPCRAKTPRAPISFAAPATTATAPIPRIRTAYQDVLDRLLLKWETAKTVVPDAVISKAEQPTRLGIIAYGSSDGAVIEARDLLEEQGIHANYLRIRAFPFTREVMDFLREHDTVFVVEQNRDAQMKSLLMLEYNDIADRMVSILHYNGMPISSECVVQGVSKHVKSEAAA